MKDIKGLAIGRNALILGPIECQGLGVQLDLTEL
jgi:hypothetical protein